MAFFRVKEGYLAPGSQVAAAKGAVHVLPAQPSSPSQRATPASRRNGARRRGRFAGSERAMSAGPPSRGTVHKRNGRSTSRPSAREYWSRHPELNWGPTDYESVALPAELCRRSRVSLAPLAERRKGSPDRARGDARRLRRAPYLAKMATRRRRAKRAAGGKRAAAQRTASRSAGTKQPASRGGRKASGAPRAGTREARAAQAARNVESTTRESPVLRVAEPAREDQQEARRADERTEERAGAAGLARAAEHAAEKAEEELRSRVAAASEELGRRREEAESDARRLGDGGEWPGLSAFIVELAIGALRLVRTVTTAPLRIGLAFLRTREA